MIALSRVLVPSQRNSIEPLKVSAIKAGKAPVGWEFLKEFLVRNKSPEGEIPRTKGVKRRQDRAESEAGKRGEECRKETFFFSSKNNSLLYVRGGGKTSQVCLAN